VLEELHSRVWQLTADEYNRDEREEEFIAPGDMRESVQDRADRRLGVADQRGGPE